MLGKRQKFVNHKYTKIKGNSGTGGSSYVTVSQELRWILQFLCKKLFSRADVALHKILILLKGHFTIYRKKQSSVCGAHCWFGIFLIRGHLNIVSIMV